MKATIEFDDALYRRLKIEAARRGRTVRDLVADGVRHVLDTQAPEPAPGSAAVVSWKPAWLGALAPYGAAVADHDPAAVRESVVRGRSRESSR